MIDLAAEVALEHRGFNKVPERFDLKIKSINKNPDREKYEQSHKIYF